MNSYKLASSSSHIPNRCTNRRGAALAEVLISLLITAIGLIGIASLFPISVLRAVQATKITKATFLRNNVEELIDFDSRLVHDPNGDGIFSTNPADADAALGHNGTNYVIDPLGHMLVESQALNTDQFGQFGNLPQLPRMGLGRILDPIIDKSLVSAPPPPAPPFVSLDYLTFKAMNLVTLPDTWVYVGEAIVNIVDPNFIDVTGTDLASELGSVSIADPVSPTINKPPSRVTVASADGMLSVSRIISGVSGSTINLASSLPPNFVNNGQFRVIVENQDYRYSWMLTVRKGAGNNNNRLVSPNVPTFGGTISSPPGVNGAFPSPVPLEIGSASVDVVVFFNRVFTQTDETVYRVVKQGQQGFGDEGGRQFQVTWSVGSRPAIKKGGYMLDPDNARWYRITKIENETDTSALILLDTLQPASDSIALHQGIFMKGVIEVFPLGNK